MVDDVTGVKAEAGADGGAVVDEEARGLDVAGAVVAADAIELSRPLADPWTALPEGVGVLAGVAPSAGVDGPVPGLTRCSDEERERNMASICGLSI